MPKPKFMLTLVALMLLHHCALWAVLIYTRGLDWVQVLSNWDSGWYDRIIQDGYQGLEWAFYPLYPLLVRGVATTFGLMAWPQVVGSVLSLLLFSIFCALMAKLASKPLDPDLEGLLPKTRLGWFFFVYSPASYVLHSHHTESLYLVLSFAALVACVKRKWLVAAVLAGLCALTKNQGVFLAIAIAVGSAALTDGKRARVFIVSGLISGALFALYPLHQYLEVGDPLAFAHSQSAWRAEISAFSYFKTFWFGNPWQNTNLGSILRHVFFFALIPAVWLVWRQRFFIGLYAALYVAIMPLSGEFVGVFRYGSVLFPALFALGDRVSRWPRPVIIILVILMVLLNHSVARNFIIMRWPY